MPNAVHLHLWSQQILHGEIFVLWEDPETPVDIRVEFGEGILWDAAMLTKQGVDGCRISVPGHQAGHAWVHHHLRTVWPCECKTALEVANNEEKLSLQEKKKKRETW